MWVAPNSADVFSRAIESRKPERPCAPAGSSVRRANTHVGARSPFGRVLGRRRAPTLAAFSVADVEHDGG
jgi:hypothetical protein